MTKRDWEKTKEKYPLGMKVGGIIRKVWKLGVLIELDDGTEGILRDREVSWDDVISDLSKYIYQGRQFYLGQKIEVAVISYDYRKHRLMLSLRYALYDPWEHHASEYQIGMIVRGRVVNILNTHAQVELINHIYGRISQKEIVPWEINAIESILERGDDVEAVILDKDETNRELIISMKTRLLEIGEDLDQEANEEPIWITEPTEIAESLSNGGPNHHEPFIPRKIDRILITDDNQDEIFNIESILSDLGYENLESTTSFTESVIKVRNENFDLVLMDILDSDKALAGLDAIQIMCREKPDMLSVLVTGLSPLEVYRKVQELNIDTAGMILKPVLPDNLSMALNSLKITGYAGWPFSLDNESGNEIEFVQDISRASTLRQPLPDVLSKILSKTLKFTSADKAVIFSMDPRDGWVEMVSSLAISNSMFAHYRRILPKSPVNDVIYKGEHIYENDIERFEGKYRNLRLVVDFKSCIGVPIEGIASDIGYGLFLLHGQLGHFSNMDLVRAEASAAIIGLAIRENWMIEQVATDQRLTLLGSTISSVGHELRNRSVAFGNIKYLEQAWAQLKQEPKNLESDAFRDQVDSYIAKLTIAKMGLSDLTEILLGAIKHNPEEIVDINICLQSAIKMVAYQATKEGVAILFEDANWLPKIKGNRFKLEQVFMNILINAVQQNRGSRRRVGKITIETTYSQEDEQRSIKIRFIDTGPGIHRKHIERIFEPMYTTKSKGTGMGLYICRELLAPMNGQIKVEKTAILIGTTIVVELPIAK